METYRAALDTLPRITRAAFLLHLLDDLDYIEVGFRLDISSGCVARYIAHALRSIDRALDEAEHLPKES